MRSAVAGALIIALAGCGANTLQDLDENRAPQMITVRGRTVVATGNEAYGASNREHDVAASLTTVWSALPPVFAELGIEPNRADRSNRILGVEDLRTNRIAGQRPSEFFECGQSVGGRLANTQELTVTILAQVAPVEAESSVLRVVVNGFVRNRNHGGGVTQCRTKGGLEQLIADMVRESVVTS
jgi:hypothetical protein